MKTAYKANKMKTHADTTQESNHVAFDSDENTEYVVPTNNQSPMTTLSSSGASNSSRYLDEIALLKRGKITRDTPKHTYRRGISAEDSKPSTVLPITMAELNSRGLRVDHDHVVYNIPESSKDNTCSQSMEHSKSKSAGRRSGSKERRRKLDKVKKKRRKNVKEKSQRIDRSIEREEKSTTKSFQSQEQEFPPEDRKSQVICQQQVDCIEIEGVIYFKGRKLAKGGSGSVWHVTRKDNGMKFALKETSLKRNGAIYRGEVERLQALSGAPHIIALVAQ
ncbi:hypothetical protein NECAME_05408 [Necator americanus]|uniref:Protein kinase domain-containing protein n=1 Tax=Necator americanus TaxID=51031 RepID=W2SJL9_NECAM|nr:hypothetical protein NECAME_05408 [Necator americanus]ETN68952.1 hypothetical protein NECAME_05408 [Necator americanus]